MTHTATLQAVAQSRFLIIGYGNERQGDGAVGPRVADIVANWQLPAIKTVAVQQLTPDLVNDLVATDYVIFVDACSGKSCARTVQIDPIVAGSRAPRTLPAGSRSDEPLALLNLTRQLYGRGPQAWLLQVPSESFEVGKGLSSTTQQGCDRAVRTIEQFIKTYQPSAWRRQAAVMQSV
ncbi:MAG: hydrogenase maturation protease [Phormidesmis sp.]